MSTPMHVYRDIAEKYLKKRDLADSAVEKFFERTVPTLPTERQEEILTALLRHNADAGLRSQLRHRKRSTRHWSVVSSVTLDDRHDQAVVEMRRVFSELPSGTVVSVHTSEGSVFSGMLSNTTTKGFRMKDVRCLRRRVFRGVDHLSVKSKGSLTIRSAKGRLKEFRIAKDRALPKIKLRDVTGIVVREGSLDKKMASRGVPIPAKKRFRFGDTKITGIEIWGPKGRIR